MSKERRKCALDSNVFCYICGRFTTPKEKGKITEFIQNAYHAYFGVRLGDQDKRWAPHRFCASCVFILSLWTKGEKHFTFEVPMVWREPKNHSDGSYFCSVNVSGMTSKTRSFIQYPNLPSALQPISQSNELPVPVFKALEIPDSESDFVPTEDTKDIDEEFDAPGRFGGIPQLFTQADLNDLVRDLDLPKNSAELLASRFKDRNLLAPGTVVSFYHNREIDLVQFFRIEDEFVFCDDINGLLNAMGCEYEPVEWRLFTDSSKRSLKCVLLHNENVFASIPKGHSVQMKKSYDSMKQVFEKLKYSEHNWKFVEI